MEPTGRAKSRSLDVSFRVFFVCGLAFGVWSLAFTVWSLAFGVWVFLRVVFSQYFSFGLASCGCAGLTKPNVVYGYCIAVQDRSWSPADHSYLHQLFFICRVFSYWVSGFALRCNLCKSFFFFSYCFFLVISLGLLFGFVRIIPVFFLGIFPFGAAVLFVCSLFT